jgi:hypothetical protein
MLETLSILVHANSKVGKTTLSATAPKPMLILDAEGGSKFLPGRKIAWDPMITGPPTYDGTWDYCIVIVRDFDTVRRCYDWLQFGGHSFQSLSVDSISEIQRRCKQALVGTEAMKMQEWGQILSLMDSVIRGFRDLTLHPTCPIRVVIFIAETRENSKGKWIPYMQGQITIALPYWMDIVGYLYVEDVATEDPLNPVRSIRRLLISPHPQYEAGERVQGRLGSVIDEPNISTMLMTVYPPEQPQPTPEVATQ